jgi:hypothetical protein
VYDDECLPAEIETFQKMDRAGNILQCPVCHTFFWYSCIIDNDIFCPRHEEELIEMAEENAMRIVLAERADDQAYHQVILSRFGAVFANLDHNGRAVFRYLIDERGEGASLATLKSLFSNENDRLLQTLDRLLEKELIIRTIHPSHTVGESGFQEEVKEIRDWNIHYRVNFDYYDFITKRWNKKKKKKKRESFKASEKHQPNMEHPTT